MVSAGEDSAAHGRGGAGAGPPARQLRTREQRLRDVGLLTLTEIAALLSVSTGTVKAWHHAGLITGHPYNDKGQCLYPPPGPNPPSRTQGRKLSKRATLLTAPVGST